MINKRRNGEQTTVHRDILARLLEVSEKDEAKLSPAEIIALTTTNLIAGSDSTAIGLRAILYFLCRTPHAYARLQREVDDAFASGAVSSPIKYAEGAKLPYLHAVVTEALRAHAATGFVLEREVPSGGATIAGKFIPGGTIVGINSWVMHANRQVYGEDAEAFNPERWFEGEERVREMKRCNMAVSGAVFWLFGYADMVVVTVWSGPARVHRSQYLDDGDCQVHPGAGAHVRLSLGGSGKGVAGARSLVHEADGDGYGVQEAKVVIGV